MKLFWYIVVFGIIALIIYTGILFIGIKVKHADLRDRINTELVYEGANATEDKLRAKFDEFLKEKHIDIPDDSIQIMVDWSKLFVHIGYTDSVNLFKKFTIYRNYFTVEDTVYFANSQ
ncbi:MAG TPA: hypothetical protein ENK92_02710 [Bacteroidetes bacterium]|uniref:Uncharacterized protein n=1 Tax=candidate division TA06 bacterium TaxID=2250710 RepID=A0A660SA97_UNCT6|nr:MAG: hypothetical protein DRP44_01525 [candidate division TA06 bacterium]HHD82996.1 hypothetical protein [Bacteroidota bacterium]